MPIALEEAAAKTMGSIRATKATLRGLTGVFKKLMQEHGEVSALMMRVSLSADEAVRRELYPVIRRELLSHERGELDVVYPAVGQHPHTVEIVEEHAREAGELDAAIRALDAVDFADAEWEPAFEHLFTLVKRHVHEEESEFFPTAQKALGDADAKALQADYEAVKEAALAAAG